MTRPIRILLVEDNPGDVELMRDAFEENAYPLEITVVGDGAKAVEYLLQLVEQEASSGPPDLVFLDLNLPKMSGHDVLKATRKADDLRALPIIVVTSSDATRDVLTSYALGANCYVTKPGDLAAFQTVVKAVGDFWFSVVKLP